MQTKQCKECKKKFKVDKKYYKVSLYCSKECQKKSQLRVRRERSRQSHYYNELEKEKCSVCKLDAHGFIDKKSYCKKHFDILKFNEINKEKRGRKPVYSVFISRKVEIIKSLNIV